MISSKQALIEGTALVAALAASAGAAAGAVQATSGNVNGAPGISHSLSRLGHLVGGGMLSGVAVVAGGAALIGLTVYQGVRQLNHL